MKREFLVKLGVSEDDIKKIMDENGKDIEREKQKVEGLQSRITTLVKDKDDSDKALLELQKKAKGDEDLEKSLADAIADSKTAKKAAEDAKAKYDADMLERDRNDAVSAIIKSYKPKNEKAALSLLDPDKITYDQNTKTVSGVKEQMDALKKSEGYLFDSTGVKFEGMKPGEAGDSPEATPSAPTTLGDAVKQHYEKGANK